MEILMIIFMGTLIISSITTSDVTDTIVNTIYGPIKGKTFSYENENVYQFLKVPFAKPPVGALRFQKPQKPDNWNDTLNATHHGSPCMQKLSNRYRPLLENAEVSEDCLYLNIYVPRKIDRDNSLAVMLYVHGGSYRTKTASLFDGSYLALHGDVIVVTTNYRLGFFGFISTDDESAKGNYGLWDQIFALRWIKDNINNFGGDPNRVTIFGHSSGGYSIGLLLISEETKGLFQRAIPMSGFGLSPRAITHNARQTTFRLASKLGCNGKNNSMQNTSAIMDCIKNKSASEILTGQTEIVHEDAESPQFIMRPAPVIDGEILRDTPQNILNNFTSSGSQRFLSADYMAGTNSDDGGLIRSYLNVLQNKFNFSNSDGAPTSALCDSIAPALARDYYGGNSNVSSAISKMYSSNISLTDQAKRLVDLFGDMMYESPAVRTLTHHSMGTHGSYRFIFSHKASFVIVPSLPPWITGAYHGDEVVFIFGMPIYNFTAQEKTLSAAFMTYWTNFAKFGTPSPAYSTSLPSWPVFKIENQELMNLDLNLSVQVNLHRERIMFWLDSIPNINKTTSHAISAASPSVSYSVSLYLFSLLAILFLHSFLFGCLFEYSCCSVCKQQFHPRVLTNSKKLDVSLERCEIVKIMEMS